MKAKIYFLVAVLLITFMPASALCQLADTPWPKFHHDLRNTGKTANFGTQVGKLKWQFITDAPVTSSPVLDDNGTLYVGSEDNNLYAIDSKSGLLIWKYLTGGAIEMSSPALDQDGTLYIGSNDGKLYAFDTKNIDTNDPQEKWTYPTNGAINSSPSIDNNGNIIFTSNDGYAYAVKPDGSWAWDTKIGASWTSPAIDNNKVYVGSWKPQVSTISSYPVEVDNETIWFPSFVNLFALNSKSGAYLWDFPPAEEQPEFCVPGGVLSSPAIAPDGSIFASYFITFANPKPCDAKVWKYNVFNIDSTDGSTLWKLNLSSDADIYSTPAVLEDNSIFVPAGDIVYRILPDMTSYLEVKGDGERFESSPAIDGGMLVFVGSNGGRFYCFCADCPETPILWQYPPADKNPIQKINVDGSTSVASITSSPAIGDDDKHSVYVGASDGSVYAFYDGPRIYGTVKLNDPKNGTPLPGVTITLTSEFTDDERVTYTDSTGYFMFAGLESFTYKVTPDKILYYFKPEFVTRSITNDLDAQEVQFTAIRGLTLSGSVVDNDGIGLPGVTITITTFNDVDFEKTVLTDENGKFEFNGLKINPYTVTPELGGYEFTPPSRPADMTLSEDMELDEFIAEKPAVVGGGGGDDEDTSGISGFISMQESDNASVTDIEVMRYNYTLVWDSDDGWVTLGRFKDKDIPNPDGLFVFSEIDKNTTYIVKPELDGYSFEPASRTVKYGSESVHGISFQANKGFHISGRVSGLFGTAFEGINVSLQEGSNVSLEGPEGKTTVTEPDGVYTFSGLSKGTYTVSIDPATYTTLPGSPTFQTVDTFNNIDNVNFILVSGDIVVYFNLPFWGSSGTLVNIYGNNFGFIEPSDDSGLTGVYFGKQDIETWKKADVVYWTNNKIVAEAPSGDFELVYVWVIKDTEDIPSTFTLMPTNFFLLGLDF